MPGFKFQDNGFTVKQLTDTGAGQRTLATGGITPYAFEASSV